MLEKNGPLHGYSKQGKSLSLLHVSPETRTELGRFIQKAKVQYRDDSLRIRIRIFGDGDYTFPVIVDEVKTASSKIIFETAEGLVSLEAETSSLHRDTSPQPSAVFRITIETLSRKKRSALLRETLESNQKTNAGPAYLYSKSEGTERIIYVNRRFETVTGFSYEKSIGKSLDQIAQNRAEGKYLLMEKGDGRQGQYIRTEHALGIFPASTYHIGYLHDMTRERENVRRLRHTSALYRTAFDNGSIGFAILDQTGNILSFNAEADRTIQNLGGTALQVDTSLVSHFPNEHWGTVSGAFEMALQKRRSEIPFRYEDFTKQEHHISLAFKCVRTNDGDPVVFASFPDKTETRMLEQTRKALRKKTRFFANMSHEIRTPLNGMLGMIDLLAKNETSPEKLEKLEIIQYSSEQLMRVINDVLDFSKLEAGKMRIRNSVYDLRQTIRKTQQLFVPKAKEKNIEIAATYGKDVPGFIFADQGKFSQILTNLLSNAVKYSENGRIRIHVEKDKTKPSLEISVSDQGIGIPTAQLTHLFSQYYQADNQHWSTEKKGSGLGLAICKQMAELMGGNISASSELEKGSRFTLSMPYQEAIQQANTTHQPHQTERHFEGLTLLADDSSVNRRVMGMMLEELGLAVIKVENGKQALEEFAKHDFDLVLLDIRMPVLDGFETAKEIRKGHRNPPPIVALSGETQIPKHLENRFDDHLSKPVNIAQLEKCFEKVLQEKKEKTSELDKRLLAHPSKKRIIELINDFESDALDLILNLGQSYENGDNELTSAIRILKGMATLMGSESVYRNVVQLERSLNQNTKEQLPLALTKLLRTIQSYVDTSKKLLKTG
ncbi:hypothetical protein FUAX_30660 [Fulvitalea axinellae]|uniref:histidine kinase n=1 Tax=Fulvitalea axinellae TaxID=1182444 RepID=A0AAU9CEP1_9BACT|nr:hypothetical protein FUAX_30660 [Fulvitalea axinellae]